jgi:hypothetical protein
MVIVLAKTLVNVLMDMLVPYAKHSYAMEYLVIMQLFVLVMEHALQWISVIVQQATMELNVIILWLHAMAHQLWMQVYVLVMVPAVVLRPAAVTLHTREYIVNTLFATLEVLQTHSYVLDMVHALLQIIVYVQMDTLETNVKFTHA